MIHAVKHANMKQCIICKLFCEVIFVDRNANYSVNCALSSQWKKGLGCICLLCLHVRYATELSTPNAK